jgi:hypothetical protein
MMLNESDELIEPLATFVATGMAGVTVTREAQPAAVKTTTADRKMTVQLEMERT